MLFVDRVDAGRRLAERLRGLPRDDLVVLGLPRGGVPVAFEVARELDVSLDIIVVRKLGVPYQPELAMGAIGEGGVRVLNDRVVEFTGVTPSQIDEAQTREEVELARRATRFRGTRQRVRLTGRVALIVDDGIATGSTVRAACKVARAQGAARVIVATPVAPPETVASLQDDADEVIALHTPQQFFAIGQFYEDFAPTPDDEVVRLLAASREPVGASAAGAGDAVGDSPARDEEVEVHAGAATVGGHLTVPDGARAIVVFAHGSGSSRHSSRNQFVASVLNQRGVRDTSVRPAHHGGRARPRERVRHPVACRAGWSTSPGGCAPNPKGSTRRSGTSARARAPVPPSGRPPNPTPRCSPWCHVAAVPTSQHRGWETSGRPRC